MRLLQLLLSSIFIFITVEHYYAYPDKNGNNESPTESSIESSTEDILHLPDIVPKHYKIQLELAAEEDKFYGTSEVNITIKNATRFIYLHSKELNITNYFHSKDWNVTNLMYLSKTESFSDKIMHVVQKYQYMEKIEIILLYFDYKLSPGIYILHMKFTSHITIIDNNIGGFFKTSYINNKGNLEWLIATRTWSMGARRMFPCWDEPKFRAKFTITIKHHAKYTALSNMPISTLEIINATAVTSFKTTPAIPTHLIAIVLCELPIISVENINWRGRQQLIDDQRFARSVIETVTHYFENKWKVLQIFSIVQHIAIPGLLDDGMAKWALVSYRDEDIIYNKELDPIARKMKGESLIGRKISRQWLSTVVSPSSWSYMWLNEGIATLFYVADVVNETIGSNMSDFLAIQTLQESLHLDVLSTMDSLISETNQTSDINSIFSFSYYVKAPAIMRMMQHVLSDNIFRNGINIYLKRQSASLNDFWADMQTAYNEVSTKPFDMKNVMDPWIKQESFPVLFVLRQDQYVNVTNGWNWTIPTTYTMQRNLDFNNTLPVFWIKPGNNTIPLHLSLKDDWIIFNIQQTGYYRVNYNNENWLKIARYLNSENYRKIHVLNRAQIIDDAFHLMITNQLNSDIFWDLANYLSQETDYIAWYPMFKAIEYISYLFPFFKNEQLKIKVLNQLRPVLRKIGYEEYSEENDFTKCLRQEAVRWACVLGDPECKTEAVTKLKWHLENPKNNKLLPWWKSWTYCYGLAAADDVTVSTFYVLNIYKEIFLNDKNTKRFEFFTCSNKNFFLMHTFIDLIESKSYNKFSLIDKNYISFFHYIVKIYARNNVLLGYILANWNKIKPKEIDTTTALIDIINHVYSEEQLVEILKFVKNMASMPLTVIFNHEYFGSILLDKRMIHELSKSSTNSSVAKYCTKHAELIKDSIIRLRFSNIVKKINIRLSEIKKHMDFYASVNM